MKEHALPLPRIGNLGLSRPSPRIGEVTCAPVSPKNYEVFREKQHRCRHMHRKISANRTPV